MYCSEGRFVLICAFILFYNDSFSNCSVSVAENAEIWTKYLTDVFFLFNILIQNFVFSLLFCIIKPFSVRMIFIII